VPVRPARSILSVPATNPRMIEKGLGSGADIAFLDLEDAVAPDAKPAGRALAVNTVANADWQGKPRAIRINAVGTPWFARDLIDLIEQTGDRLDLIVLPKVDSLADLVAVDRLLASLETSVGRSQPVRIEAQIESAGGLAACAAIAGGSARLESLVYGPGDLAASLRMPGLGIGMRGEWDDAYGADRHHFTLMTILVAARANGLRAVDGPYADFRDADGLRISARRSRALGYDGKWCIHPGQIEIVNEVFSPTAEEITHARSIIDAYREATTRGEAALVHQGVMIDTASLRMAEATLELANRANTKQS
jgi:citrate lyase subunit beta/citryl-CoA lyase